MALTSGTKLGPYEIQAALGAGGIGEVYRARDTRVGRDVAVKVLPESFSSDADRLQRFEQEARVLGTLSHPNLHADPCVIALAELEKYVIVADETCTKRPNRKIPGVCQQRGIRCITLDQLVEVSKKEAK